MLDTESLIAAGRDSGDALAMDLSLALSNAIADVNSRDAEIQRLHAQLTALRTENDALIFDSAHDHAIAAEEQVRILREKLATADRETRRWQDRAQRAENHSGDAAITRAARKWRDDPDSDKLTRALCEAVDLHDEVNEHRHVAPISAASLLPGAPDLDAGAWERARRIVEQLAGDEAAQDLVLDRLLDSDDLDDAAYFAQAAVQ